MKLSIGRILGRLRNSLSPPIDISDAFVLWICFVNAGMLERGNLYCFDYAIRNLPSDAPMLEIGSFCGLSTNLINYYRNKQHAPNRLISCDRWEFEGAKDGPLAPDTNVAHSEYREFARETYLRNVRMFSRDNLPYTIEKYSDEFFEAWRREETVQDVFGRELKLGGPLSFCYIDGNHSYDFVKRDFQNCDTWLERGGFILFDDSRDGSEWEVCRVIREIKAGNDYEVVAKNPNYLFRKR